MAETFYEVLDVPPDAGEEAITDAYRSAVKEVHPDVSDREDAADRFKLVQRAEEVLTDDAERRRYDRLGHERYVRLAGDPDLHDLGENEGGAEPRSDIQEAAARAANGEGSSYYGGGPTNEGASPGWREQRRRWRRAAGPDDWTFGPGPEDSFQREHSGSEEQSGTGSSGASGTGSSGASATRTGSPGPNDPFGATSTGGGAADTTDRSMDDEAHEEWYERATAPGGGSRATRKADGSGGYAVKDWNHEGSERSVLRTDWSQETPGFFVGSFLLYPVMLASSVLPGFPFEMNLIIGACTLFLAGYLLTRPGISAIVFGVWGVVLPLTLAWSSLPLFSMYGLVALIGTWIPFAYAVMIGVVLTEAP